MNILANDEVSRIVQDIQILIIYKLNFSKLIEKDDLADIRNQKLWFKLPAS